jgi:hypothetical protein
MLDESTDQSGKKVLLLYLRFYEKGRFVTKYRAALEVPNASAEGLFQLIVKHFEAMQVPIFKLFTYMRRTSTTGRASDRRRTVTERARGWRLLAWDVNVLDSGCACHFQ